MTDTQTSEKPENVRVPNQDGKKRLPAAVRSPGPDGVRASAARRSGGRRTIINFWLDAGLLCLFVTLGIVAVIVQFVFPPGVAARGWLLWGMSYGEWCSVQFGILCVLALAVLVHVMLHWTWICGVVVRRLFGRSALPDDGIRTLYGVGLLIILLNLAAFVVAVARFTIEAPGN